MEVQEKPPLQIYNLKTYQTGKENTIKVNTIICWHLKCFAKCSSKVDVSVVSNCSFLCHNTFYSSNRLTDTFYDNPTILSSGNDKLSVMKADVSIFCHFDLCQLMLWKLMRMLHEKSKSIHGSPPNPISKSAGKGKGDMCYQIWSVAQYKGLISSQDSYRFNKLFMLRFSGLEHHRDPSVKLQQ